MSAKLGFRRAFRLDWPNMDRLRELYRSVRRSTELLCEPLAVEDQVVQTMAEVSPTKWHLAHTSWFFETFALKPVMPDYHELDPRYGYLFNSYYQAAGERVAQPDRGHQSRPTVAEVLAYRRHVDEWMARLFDDPAASALAFVIELGLNHEEQHQELILTDAKHVLAANPLDPVYKSVPARPETAGAPGRYLRFEGGLYELGHAGKGFVFDNEEPRHRIYLQPFELHSRPTTAGEFLAFLRDGGYQRPELWLSDGWDECRRAGWRAPLYWREHGGGFQQMTLTGLREVDPAEPVCHVSFYEADAYARWAGARLPLEAEWEVAAADREVEGNFLDSGRLHPAPASGPDDLQLFGDVWEWTASPYLPYPGYRPFAGALGEYNGKFMSNRMVLRGGSCVTPARHLRATYRNFFAPATRWQLSGIRLARGVEG